MLDDQDILAEILVGRIGLNAALIKLGVGHGRLAFRNVQQSLIQLFSRLVAVVLNGCNSRGDLPQIPQKNLPPFSFLADTLPAVEVHRELGPGLLEGTYEAALCIEFTNAGLGFLQQHKIPVVYKGHLIGEYKPDLIVDDAVVVEVKSVERF